MCRRFVCGANTSGDNPAKTQIVFRCILFIGIILFLWYGGTLLYLIFTGPIDTSRRADAALVLGTGIHSNGKPNPCLAARVQKGVDLFKTGTVRIVILSGGNEVREDNTKQSQADVMRDIAITAGMDERYLFTETESTSTYENIVFSRKALDYYLAQSAIVVTEPYHSPRARMTAERHLNQTVFAAPAAESPCWTDGTFGRWYLWREPFAFWYYLLSGKS